MYLKRRRIPRIQPDVQWSAGICLVALRDRQPEVGKHCKAGDTGPFHGVQQPPDRFLVKGSVNGLGQLMPHTGNGEIRMECFFWWTGFCTGLLRDTSFLERERPFRLFCLAGTCVMHSRNVRDERITRRQQGNRR
ncbi:hypothetical protein PMSD_21445 [Paenibacillus macquariensis subsp. defensor]|nr:hypothetical protein PMSD_21445 [Paenibacillus macquariensis subsp. defensor]